MSRAAFVATVWLASACADEPRTPAPKLAGTTTVFESAVHSYTIDTVVSGLSHPWGLAFLPNGDLLITERDGRLRWVRNGALEVRAISGVPPVRAIEQGGLLDVALHPRFAENQLVYLSFSKPGVRGATTAVVRGTLDGFRLRNVEEVFEARAWSYGTGHFGSRLLFDSAGHLFVSVGERRSMESAQDLTVHNGKIIRLHDDGRVPADNPFVGRRDARPEIWAYGTRNPQGLAWHPGTGELWESEHGPMGGDEINVIRRGANYGWPIVTFGINYTGRPISDKTHQEGIEAPVHYFLPSIGTSGLAIYAGDAFPGWRGDAFVGGLVGQQLARISFRNGTTSHERLVAVRERIRDVRVGPDGLIYLLVDSPDAPLIRLMPAG